jgi:hypothetical protein
VEPPLAIRKSIATKKSFGNFELRLKIRSRGSGGLVTSGSQIRSTQGANKRSARA